MELLRAVLKKAKEEFAKRVSDEEYAAAEWLGADVDPARIGYAFFHHVKSDGANSAKASR